MRHKKNRCLRIHNVIKLRKNNKRQSQKTAKLYAELCKETLHLKILRHIVPIVKWVLPLAIVRIPSHDDENLQMLTNIICMLCPAVVSVQYYKV